MLWIQRMWRIGMIRSIEGGDNEVVVQWTASEERNEWCH